MKRCKYCKISDIIVMGVVKALDGNEVIDYLNDLFPEEKDE